MIDANIWFILFYICDGLAVSFCALTGQAFRIYTRIPRGYHIVVLGLLPAERPEGRQTAALA